MVVSASSYDDAISLKMKLALHILNRDSIFKFARRSCTCYWLGALLIGLIWSVSLHAQTVTLYGQDFQNPSGPNGDIYFNVATPYNGITDGTGTGASFAGNSLVNGQIVSSTTGISGGQGGSGFFLFDNTGGTTSDYSSGMEIWGTQTAIAVRPNSTYTFSFYLANDNAINNASIQPVIDGVALSSGVTPTGVGTWEQFSFSWNSGTNTNANLELTDLASNPTGNDFGVDTIAFTGLTPLPELPTAALLLLGLGLLGLMQVVSHFRTRAGAC
jgi:hypothetical protein